MARIRTLKPEFFRSKSMARCSHAARLTFQGMWCEADDFGRGPAEPRVLKGAVWPLEDEIQWGDVEKHLTELADAGCISLYEVDGERYYEIPSWEHHQSAAYRRGKAQFPSRPPTPTIVQSASPIVQDARLIVLEEELGRGTGNGERGLAPRARDELFDAVCEACLINTTELGQQSRGPLNRAVADLRNAGAVPNDVSFRAKAYRQLYPDAALTPMALAKHWPALGRGSPSRLPRGSDALERQVADLGGGRGRR